MNSAISLTLALFMTLTIGMPMVGWLMSRRYKQQRVNIWFLTIVFDSLQIPIVAAQASYPGWMTYVIPNTISVLFYITLWSALRLERGPIARFWSKVLLVGIFYLLPASIIFELVKRSPLYFYSLNNLVYLALGLIVAFEAWRVGRSERSLGLYFVSLGFIIGSIGYAVRAYWNIVLNTSIPVFEFSAASNFLVIALALNLVLVTFGYLGFIRDKAESKNIALATEAADAVARQEESRKYTQELLETIKERDQMVMVNSRFLNLGALATFNSAIVHEISQPLLAVEMCLENLRAQDGEQGGALATEISESIALANKAGEVVNALRQMMVMGTGTMNITDVVRELRSVIPIIQGEARRRGVRLVYELLDHEVYCDCNGVLFQRLIINLVSNAFEALETAQTTNPTLEISCSCKLVEGKQVIGFKVVDNGPGIEGEALKNLFKPFDTKKPSGIGIGLSLANILLRKWQGRITAHNVVGGTGMAFEIMLPISVKG